MEQDTESIIKYKQFVIIPKQPKMSAGKIASQTAHATFCAIEKQTTEDLKINKQLKAQNIIEKWKESGMCVIVLECPTQIELMNIAKYCEEWKIPHHLYIDEGHTEIPMGTATALATGVLTEDQFWMFSTMKLYTDEKPFFKRLLQNR